MCAAQRDSRKDFRSGQENGYNESAEMGSYNWPGDDLKLSYAPLPQVVVDKELKDISLIH